MIAQRVTLVTLGVSDMARARRFYGAWGWSEAAESQPPEVVFYQLAGLVLGLYAHGMLARDQGRDDLAQGSGAVTLAVNFDAAAEVDAAFATATGAGATVLAPPAKQHWGGYVGYLADPDGHVWELAHNPFWPLGPDGELTLPSARPA
ncbi:MAG TPA: VOC family protein [Thermohalobaculum sp.]|nr:VOC family protein [Thermohalobaculum sp.]